MMNLMQAMGQFPNFMNMMRGQNPDSVLQQMVNSGRLSRQQLNQATQQANSIMGQMEQFKSMFGF